MNVLALAPIIAGVIGGFLGWRFRLPGGTLIWSLVPAAIASLSLPGTVELDRLIILGAQAAIGIVIGSGLRADALLAMRRLVWAILVGLAVLIGTSTAIGVALWRSTEIPAAAAILATVPGSASDITAMALELGSDVGLIAGFQLVRQFTVLAVVGTVLQRLGRPE